MSQGGLAVGKHRMHRVASAPQRRRRLVIAGLLGVGLVGGMVGTALPLLASDQAIYAVADTTATGVVQDGDNSSKTTLATCPALCERNPRGARDAVLEFVVTSLPANAVNVRARLEVHAWENVPVRITAHASEYNARTARPELREPGPELDAVDRVLRGYNAFDVSDLITANGSYTISLRQHGRDSRLYWASLENRNRSIRPRLVLSYATRPIPGSPSARPAARPPLPRPTETGTPPEVSPSAASPSPSASAPASAPPSPSSECGRVSPKLVPSCGAWWGIHFTVERGPRLGPRRPGR